MPFWELEQRLLGLLESYPAAVVGCAGGEEDVLLGPDARELKIDADPLFVLHDVETQTVVRRHAGVASLGRGVERQGAGSAVVNRLDLLREILAARCGGKAVKSNKEYRFIGLNLLVTRKSLRPVGHSLPASPRSLVRREAEIPRSEVVHSVFFLMSF